MSCTCIAYYVQLQLPPVKQYCIFNFTPLFRFLLKGSGTIGHGDVWEIFWRHPRLRSSWLRGLGLKTWGNITLSLGLIITLSLRAILTLYPWVIFIRWWMNKSDLWFVLTNQFFPPLRVYYEIELYIVHHARVDEEAVQVGGGHLALQEEDQVQQLRRVSRGAGGRGQREIKDRFEVKYPSIPLTSQFKQF